MECGMSQSNGWIGNWNMEFCDPKKGLGMEFEYGKFHVEIYSDSGIRFLALVIKMNLWMPRHAADFL